MVAGSGPPPNSCFALRASQVFDFSERRSRPDTTIRGLLGQRSRTAYAEMVWRWSPSEDKEHLGRAFSTPGERAAAFADGLAYPGSPSTSIRSTLSG